MSQLRAFDAVARFGNLSNAARELGVTQSALSHAITALENVLGAKLFIRSPREASLTQTAQAMIPAVKAALDAVRQVQGLAAISQAAPSLNILVWPAYASYAVIPRLDDWKKRHPDIGLRFVRHFLDYETVRDEVDAAIVFGAGVWPGAEALELGGNLMVAVCAPKSPALARFHANRLLAGDFLHHSQVPEAWSAYFPEREWGGTAASKAAGKAAGKTAQGAAMSFDMHAQILEAALSGLGVALLPWFVAEPAVRAGGLKLCSKRGARLARQYYLVYKKTSRFEPNMQCFKDWVLRESRRLAAEETRFQREYLD
jgi:LysR family transcriptional regulator, glycine cleavage system transcriptional activator